MLQKWNSLLNICNIFEDKIKNAGSSTFDVALLILSILQYFLAPGFCQKGSKTCSQAD